MYLHVVGWNVAKKDKIDLDGMKLKEKQGLYTCPPIHDGQKPFHCCLEVIEEKIKVGGCPDVDIARASDQSQVLRCGRPANAQWKSMSRWSSCIAVLYSPRLVH